MDSKNFSAFEIDAIGEILNISLGASATAVSTMLNARVDITTPVVRVLTKSEFEISNLEPAVGVEITYIAGLSGSNIMLLKKHDVKVIVDMLMGTETPEEDFELNELNISAICEVMNQMMGASATALSEFLSKAVNISTPTSFEIEDVGDFKEKYYHDEDLMVVVGFNLKIADQMASEFINVMPPALAKELVAGFFPQGGSEPEEAPVSEPVSQPASAPASSGGILSQEEIEKLLSGSSAPEPQPQEPPKQESSGGILSQEEIEMLLNGGKTLEPVPAAPIPTPAPVSVPTPAQTPQPAVSMPEMVSQTAGMDNSAVQQMMNQMQMQQQMINQMQQMILQMQNSQMNAPKKEGFGAENH